MTTMTDHVLNRLYDVLQQRKNADAEGSYVASLYKKGAAKIAEKITEEAQETIEESIRLEKTPQDDDIREALKNETADLWFHTLVMLAHHNVKPEEIFQILEKRFGIGGHDEKAARQK